MFKVGDKIKVIGEKYSPNEGGKIGDVGQIIRIYNERYTHNNFTGPLWELRIDGIQKYAFQQDLKLINTTMDLKENFALLLTKEPMKSFRKLGITNGDNILTEDGVKVFLSWMLEKHQDAFKTEVCDD